MRHLKKVHHYWQNVDVDGVKSHWEDHGSEKGHHEDPWSHVHPLPTGASEFFPMFTEALETTTSFKEIIQLYLSDGKTCNPKSPRKSLALIFDGHTGVLFLIDNSVKSLNYSNVGVISKTKGHCAWALKLHQ